MHVAVLGDHWGFPQFLHLRVLDITISCFPGSISTEGAQRAFHNILVTLTSPALEHVRLELWGRFATRPSMQDMGSRDATTDAYRAQYADLHAVLARPTFSSLHRVTVVLFFPPGDGLVSAKDLAIESLDFLRALFAPWYVRGIVSLACVVNEYTKLRLDAVVDEGKGLRPIKLARRQTELLEDPGRSWHYPRC